MGPAAVPGCRPGNPPALRPAVRVTHLKGVGPVPTGKPPGDRIGPGRDGEDGLVPREGHRLSGVPESGTDGDKSPGGRVGQRPFPVLPSNGGPSGATDAPATLGIFAEECRVGWREAP